MQKNNFVKILTRHLTPQPEQWITPDSQPKQWVETVISPLLDSVSNAFLKFVPPTQSAAQNNQDPNGQYCYIGTIVMQGMYSVARQDMDPHLADDIPVIGIPLFWVKDPSGSGHALATSTQRLNITQQRYHYSSHYDSRKDWSDLRYFASCNDLQNMMKAMSEALYQVVFQAQKNNKVRKLQVHAVKAQIQQIANAEGFAFKVETSARIIKIIILLTRSNQLSISVPFSEFENALPELRETVLKLRALHQRRIHFKIQQEPSYSQSKDWIQPERPASDTANSMESL